MDTLCEVQLILGSIYLGKYAFEGIILLGCEESIFEKRKGLLQKLSAQKLGRGICSRFFNPGKSSPPIKLFSRSESKRLSTDQVKRISIRIIQCL